MLPPGLLGFQMARQQQAQEQSQGLNQLHGLLGVQGAMRQQGLLEQQLAEKQQQKARLEAFVNGLPEQDRAAAMLSPETFIKEQYAPFNLRPGEVRYRGNQQVAAAPLNPQLVNMPVPGQPGVTQPAWIRPGEASGVNVGGQNMPEILNPAVQQAKRDVASAGAPRTQVSVNTDRTFLGQVADKVGGQVAAGADQARAALGTINTVNNIRGAMDTGQVIAGPGTSARMFLGQVGEVLGINGTDSGEKLTNTRKAIQGLAQLELDAAQQMKGQGQITEAERSIIRRAASGDIDGMTGPELRVLMDTLDKTARFKIRANAKNVERLRTNPGAGQMPDFMVVDEPPAYTPRRRESDKPSSIDDRLKKYIQPGS